MLTFIDESGHPHPNDPATRPVLASVSFAQRDSRAISAKIYGIKRNLLGVEGAGKELKAVELLNARTFKRRPELRELVESVFEQLRSLPLTIFGVVMERPERPLPRDDGRLPRQYQYLLRQVNALLHDNASSLSVVLIDGDGSQYGGLSAKMEQYLHRHSVGQALNKVVDAPYFVDSRYTVGIQLADMIAGVLRQYHEKGLSHQANQSDPYLSAVARYFRAISDQAPNTPDPSGGQDWHGIYYMSEGRHYFENDGEWGATASSD